MQTKKVVVGARVSAEFAEKTIYFVRTRGYLNVSELIREALREKMGVTLEKEKT
jgi:Arc/MetJ-type ribon-helix-helix transcriptional regulator